MQFLTLDAGRQAMEDLLVAEPDVKGVFAFNQLVLQGAYQALAQAGKAGQVKLVGFDLDPVSYQMVKDGKIDGLVVQDPFKMGYEGMNIVLTNLTGGEGAGLRRPRHEAADQGQRGRVRQRSAGDRQVAAAAGLALSPGRMSGEAHASTPADVQCQTIQPTAPSAAPRRAIALAPPAAMPGSGASASRAVQALRGVDFSIAAGRVRGLVGENGAGKSTLAKIIAGVYQPDAGSIELDGRPVRFTGADQALAQRIVTVHQDINLIQTMTVAENLLLNNEPTSALRNHPRGRMRDAVRRLLAQYEIAVDPDDVVGDAAQRPQEDGPDRQGDQPRSQDPAPRRADLVADRRARFSVALRLIRRLAAEGVGVVLISHYLAEIFEVCDDLTVMRDGEVVVDGPVSGTTLPASRHGHGRAAMSKPSRRESHLARRRGSERPLLRVEDLTVRGVCATSASRCSEGEVLGVTGLAGSGLDELARAIFGAVGTRGRRGRVLVDGRPVPAGDPAGSLQPASRCSPTTGCARAFCRTSR